MCAVSLSPSWSQVSGKQEQGSRHKLYRYLQLVKTPYDIAFECATVGMTTFLQQQSALYGFDPSNAHDFTKHMK